MGFGSDIFHAADTPMHRCDARVKLAALVAYTVALFLVRTWVGLAAAFAVLALAVGISRTSPARIVALLVPVYVLAAFPILFGGFSFGTVAPEAAAVATGGVSAGVFEGAAPFAVGGLLWMDPAGLARGCFYAARMLLLVAASLVLCATTSQKALMDALVFFLGPLRALRFPVDDAAMVCGLALRFIPLTADELGRVRAAQASRGARLDDGSLPQRLHAWATVFVPVFVGLFRRADRLAVAMDARCYGAAASTGVERTRLRR